MRHICVDSFLQPQKIENFFYYISFLETCYILEAQLQICCIHHHFLNCQAYLVNILNEKIWVGTLIKQ